MYLGESIISYSNLCCYNQRSATGSWNMWTRSAFYEMEAEVFVQSENFAAELVNKFERESAAYCIPVKTVDECLQFMPKGCPICEGFGPFYDA